VSLERLNSFEEPMFHWGLTFFCFLLFFMAILLGPITIIVRKVRKREQSLVSERPDIENNFLRWLIEYGRSITSWLSAGTSMLFFLFVILFLFIIAQADLLYGVPPIAYLIFTIPIIVAALTGIMAFFIVLAWKEGYWGLTRRIFHSTILVAFSIYLIELSYWNLLGFCF
ncbi:MAG: hypothetical protein ACFFBD_16030, partial [Candidatus Hodarchaeota archaeon]